MVSKFEALDEQKQQRILNAAMKEFSLKGYDHASTNRIVEGAGIAKGLLFHYFKSKKRLFLYLYDRALQLATEAVLGGVDFSEADFFQRIGQAQRLKIALVLAYPDIMEFLKAAYLEESEDVKAELGERAQNLLALNFRRLFEGVDASRFREGLDQGLVIKTILWAYEGFANAHMDQIRRMDLGQGLHALNAEVDAYTEFLMRCFYREDANK